MKALSIRSLVVAATIAFGSAGALAEDLAKPADFPQRPINLVVMYPAGGGVDVTARTFARVAEGILGQEFRVENRVGGVGMVGHSYLAHSARPDGYTIGVIANPFLFTDILIRDASFGPEHFDPLAFITFEPVVWTVRVDSEIGAMSFAEIAEHAKTTRLQVGMSPNSMFEFVSQFVEEAEGVEFNYVPFDGGKAGVAALLAGDIDVTSAFYSEIDQYVQTGMLRPVGVTGNNRYRLLPDIPTLIEHGVEAADQTWGAARFFILPPGVPEDRRDYLEAAIMKVLESEEAEQAFGEVGLVLAPAGTEETRRNYHATYEAMHDFLERSGRL